MVPVPTTNGLNGRRRGAGRDHLRQHGNPHVLTFDDKASIWIAFQTRRERTENRPMVRYVSDNVEATEGPGRSPAADLSDGTHHRRDVVDPRTEQL